MVHTSVKVGYHLGGMKVRSLVTLGFLEICALHTEKDVQRFLTSLHFIAVMSEDEFLTHSSYICADGGDCSIWLCPIHLEEAATQALVWPISSHSIMSCRG